MIGENVSTYGLQSLLEKWSSVGFDTLGPTYSERLSNFNWNLFGLP